MPDQSDLPEIITNETDLNELLSRPSSRLIDVMKRLDGDVIVLGIAGKMGSTLGMAAVRAIKAASVSKRVIGVSRFSDPAVRVYLENHGIETIKCDLLNREAVEALPKAKNVIYMAGRKFGTQGQEEFTWATNVIAPDNVGQQFQESRIVVFSTGCVYPLVPVSTGGCTEVTIPEPVGEYAQSCLGRERVFGYNSMAFGTPVCLMRLNYAIDLRYGVFHDIGQKVFMSHAVDTSVSHFNVIWQGDASCQALLCLEHCTSPPNTINITGPETVSVRFVANQFAELFNTTAVFTGSEEGSKMYLSNASKAIALFGGPSVSLSQMIRWQAHWIRSGGAS